MNKEGLDELKSYLMGYRDLVKSICPDELIDGEEAERVTVELGDDGTDSDLINALNRRDYLAPPVRSCIYEPGEGILLEPEEFRTNSAGKVIEIVFRDKNFGF